MAPRKLPRDRRGLTLLEVVLAVVVLSVVLLGVFTALRTAQRTDALTRERQAASEEAFKMLDTMLSGLLPESGAPVVIPFDVPYQSGVLRPANPYPTGIWTEAGAVAPSTVTMAGVAVARVNVPLVEGDTGAASNDQLIEVRVQVAWRPMDWQPGENDQRIELVSRRMR